MNNGFNKRKGAKTDDYNTSKSAYNLIKEFVPKGITLYDPFFNDGACKQYMQDVFSSCKVIHEDKDAFSWFPEGVDMVITNPPFSIKYQVLSWLVDKDIPFMCLLPLTTIATIKFSKVKNSDQIQFITGSTRIKYEREGTKGAANFESAWFCYKMNLPKDILIKSMN